MSLPTTITATARQARLLRQRHSAAQLVSGHRAWADPAIYALPDWTERLLREQGTASTFTPWQEESLWEQAIAADGGGELLQPGAAARAARRSWNLLHAWRLPRNSPAWNATPDAAAFAAWAREYEGRVDDAGRVDRARLMDAIKPRDLGHVRTFQLDDIEPAAALLVERLEAAGTHFEILPARTRSAPGEALLACCADGEQEIERAADWAFETLRANPGSQIGVAFPDLAAVRSRAAHVFRDAFGEAVHIALGPTLAERPLVAGALAVLALGPRRMRFAEWTPLLLSPWTGGDPASRARLEIEMRRRRMEEWPIDAVGRMGACPPQYRETLQRASEQIARWPPRQSASGWSAAWSLLLAEMGWPGPQALSSDEYQVIEAWDEALSEFAALEATVAPLTAEGALATLRRGLGQRRFQVEDPGRPVQVLSIDEAAGLEFDFLWVAGLHAEVWPAPPSPDPFLPLALQRAAGMPHSSPQERLERARMLTQRLQRVARQIVFSYPEAEGERRLEASPLLRGLAAMGDVAGSARVAEAAVSSVRDEQAPPLAPGTMVAGGARALELQARCPFLAFAEIRLGAEALDQPELGFDARDRGTILHDALALAWRELANSEALRGPVSEAVEKAVDRAVSKLPAFTGFQRARLELERRRLRRLIEAWLDVEKKRGAAFAVLEQEQEKEAHIGGIALRTRIDRMDRFDDGRVLLVDYKSTAPPSSAWDGERPDSPQLPLYAATSGHGLNGAVFAQVKAAELKFSGVIAGGGAIDGVKQVKQAEFEQLVDKWREALEGLAAGVQRGEAAADPKKGDETCGRCHLQMLCRIKDAP